MNDLRTFPVYLLLSIYALYHCIQNAAPADAPRETAPSSVVSQREGVNHRINGQTQVMAVEELVSQAKPSQEKALPSDDDQPTSRHSDFADLQKGAAARPQSGNLWHLMPDGFHPGQVPPEYQKE